MPVNRAIRRHAALWLPLLTAALIFAGQFARISMLARLSERSKQISAIEEQLARGEKEIARQELLLSQMHDLRRIALRAGELGMTSPTEDQLRVLCVQPTREAHTPAKAQP